jgi:hypothetical protein
MAVDILVARGSGSHQGPDIIDPYITDEAVARHRGRNELDEHAEGLQPHDMEIPYDGSIYPGHLIEVNDSELMEVWKGKVVSVSHSSDGVETITRVRVKRPTDFRVG